MNVWILGARPKTLPAAIAQVLVGTALAADSLNIVNALLALVVSLALQIGNLLSVNAEFAAELSKRFDSFESF